MDQENNIRCGMIAVVGRANVGKSTFLNRVLEEKVSIVSDVAQTTRNLVRGVLTEPRGQLVFLDTPGVHRAQSDLGKMMNRVARASVVGSDVALLLLDGSSSLQNEDEGWMKRLAREEGVRLIFVVNKCDVSAKNEEDYKSAWARIKEAKESEAEVEWWRISAETGEGVAPLLTRLFEVMSEGPYLFPEDVLTDFPKKLAIADIIREKYFGHLRAELPHSLAVKVDNIIEEEGPLWRLFCTIYIKKGSQKGILIGHKGRTLRAVKRASVKECESIYEVKVKLELRIKVEKNWDQNFFLLRQLGYAE